MVGNEQQRGDPAVSASCCVCRLVNLEGDGECSWEVGGACACQDVLLLHLRMSACLQGEAEHLFALAVLSRCPGGHVQPCCHMLCGFTA